MTASDNAKTHAKQKTGTYQYDSELSAAVAGFGIFAADCAAPFERFEAVEIFASDCQATFDAVEKVAPFYLAAFHRYWSYQ